MKLTRSGVSRRGILSIGLSTNGLGSLLTLQSCIACSGRCGQGAWDVRGIEELTHTTPWNLCYGIHDVALDPGISVRGFSARHIACSH